MSKIIELKQVSKKFNQKEIYNNISLSIREGECVGFVGENGSGKSVLFQLISGLLPADSGTVKVGNEVLGENRDFPENVGILINEPGYIEYYSGYKNLQLLAEIRNVVGDEEIQKTMELVGLDYKDKTPVRKYSMGMKQKLGIAQAIMEGQSIIILDEPYNALDYKTNHEITKILEQLKNNGKTLLLTSHQHGYLSKLCDTLYCIHENKLIPFTEELQKEYFEI
ncbi:MAG: ABC transporter ATP-binding protein [Lachnospiraceae bacterium]|nr:ABC transporter ATP-binding protein [Lachnospiraceae bacterium]